MSFQSIQSIVACAVLGVVFTTPVLLKGKAAPPPHVSRGAFEAAYVEPIPTLTADFVPAAPAGEAIAIEEPEPESRSSLEKSEQARPRATVQADRTAMAVFGDVLATEIGLELERSTRRNVIEHVIAGTVPLGIVSVEPSETERSMGARDLPLGEFQPCIVIDWSNRFRHLTRRDAQDLLSGRERFWPGTQDPVEVFTPAPGERQLLLTELMIPGDTFADSTWKNDVGELFDAVRGDRLACGVTHRAAVPKELGVLEIEGFRPSITLRAVFRDDRADEVRRLLEFWRSTRARRGWGGIEAGREGDSLALGF